jgi:pilus assembly protein CpaB
VLPDERVDIILARRIGSKRITDTILSDVRVLAVDSVIDPGTGKPVPAKSVTFEVLREDAQKLILSTGLGEISLVLRSTNPGAGSVSRSVSEDDVGSTILVDSSRGPNSSAPQQERVPQIEVAPAAQPKSSGVAQPASGTIEVRVIRGLSAERYVVPR